LLIGSSWTDENGTRPLRADDVLVVAPYNAQVAAAARASSTPPASRGRGRAPSTSSRAGQAPVVFVSMTASSIDDVPRGISFLLNRNRLNVAVSRAKYASVIVRSEAADRVPAGHAGPPGGAGRVLVARFV
jgi:superfamily I DNA and/or RNA helicase